mgnify:CR=1 FL=1
MNAEDELVYICKKVLVKNEPLTRQEFIRLRDAWARSEIRLENTSPEEWAGLQVSWQNMLRAKFFAQGGV